MAAFRLRIVTRPGSAASALPPFVLFSLLGHAAFVVALLLAPSLRGNPRIPEDAVIVRLVSASAPTSPQVRVPKPPPLAVPEPEPQPVRPSGMHVETREPPKVDPLPDKIEPSEPKPRTPAPARPRPASPVPSQTAVHGDEQASVTALTALDAEFAWYRSAVTAALYSQWRRPILAGNAQVREVRVSFEILRDGSVRRLQIESASGVPSLDRSALRAVGDAAPLPPLPSGWRDRVLPAAFVFQLLPE